LRLKPSPKVRSVLVAEFHLVPPATPPEAAWIGDYFRWRGERFRMASERASRRAARAVCAANAACDAEEERLMAGAWPVPADLDGFHMLHVGGRWWTCDTIRPDDALELADVLTGSKRRRAATVAGNGGG